MAATFDAGAAAHWMLSYAQPSSMGKCAFAVRRGLEAGGISTAGRPVAAQDYVHFLPTIGFNLISQPNPPRVGDLCVISHGRYGHICMFCGSQWVSDFKQPSFMVYHEGVRGYWFYRFNGQINGDTLGVYSFDALNSGYYASSDVEIIKSDLDDIFIPQLAYIKNMVYRAWAEDYGIDTEYCQTNTKKDSYSYLNTDKDKIAYYTNLAWKENYENAETYTAYQNEKILQQQGSYLDINYSISDLIVQYFKLGRMGNQVNSFGDFGIDMGDFSTIATGSFGGVSVNGLSFMIRCEGWSDGRRRAHLGIPGTDAVAVAQGDGAAATVGPGLTNYVSPAIRPGRLFSGAQIMALFAGVIRKAVADINRINPNLKAIGQGVLDMAVDYYHNRGPGGFRKAGWANVRTKEDAARVCNGGTNTVNGKVNRQLSSRRLAEACICLGKQATLGDAKSMTDAYFHPDSKIVALVGGK